MIVSMSVESSFLVDLRNRLPSRPELSSPRSPLPARPSGEEANTQGPQWPTHGAAKNAPTQNFLTPHGAALSFWPWNSGGVLVYRNCNLLPSPRASQSSGWAVPGHLRSSVRPALVSRRPAPMQPSYPSSLLFQDPAGQSNLDGNRPLYDLLDPPPKKEACGLDPGNWPAHQQFFSLTPLSVRKTSN